MEDGSENIPTKERNGNVIDRLREKYPTRALVAITAGFAFFLSWGFLFIHITSKVNNAPIDVFADRMFLTFSYLGMMLFAVFFIRLILPLKVQTTLPFLALAVVGVFLGGYSYLVPEASVILDVLAAIFVGLEYGWLMLLWGNFFGYVDSRSTGFCLSISFVATAAIFLLVRLLPHLAQVALAASLPILSTLSLAYGIRALSKAGSTMDAPRNSEKFHGVSPRIPWRTSSLFGLMKRAIISTSAFGIIFAIANICFGQSGFEVIGLGVLGVILLGVIMVFTSKVTVKYLYRIAQPVMGLGLALLPFNSYAGMLFVAGSYSIILFLLVLTLCEVANRFQASVVRLTGFAFGINLCALAVGEILGFSFISLSGLHGASVSILSIVLLVALMTYTAFTCSDGGFIFEFSNDSTQASENEASKNVSDNLPRRLDPRDMSTSIIIFHEAVNQRCSIIAGEYGLSAREEEVLVLITQGNSITETANKLFITQGTVKTHINHFYKKMGINSRTELKNIINIE